MLPDIPALRDDLSRAMSRHLDRLVQERVGPFARAPRHFIHEGAALRVIRSDGTGEESPLVEASAEVRIPFNEISALTPAKRAEHLEKIADDMARQMSAHMYASLNQTLEKAGQSVDAKGRPFSAELMLEVLEKMYLAFDDQGHPEIELTIGPDLAPRAKEALDKLATDPALNARYEALMEQKRAEWRAREASRKLVG